MTWPHVEAITHPTVSVVIPMFNSREYVGHALDSALAQTYSSLEVVVIDDGSTDGGNEVVSAYAERDRRIRWTRQDNRGPAAARNAGLALAKGRYVAFLDADDLWLPDKLERQVTATPQGVVYSDAWIVRDGVRIGTIGENLPLARAEGFGHLLVQNLVPVLTALMPTELLRRFGGFDECQRLRGGEDYDLWLRMSAEGTSFKFIDEPLAVYRINRGSLSGDRVAMARSRLRAYHNLTSHVDATRRRAVRRRARKEQKVLEGELRARALDRALSGCFDKAREDVWQAFRTRPLSWRNAVTVLASVTDATLRRLALFSVSPRAARRV